MKKFVKSVVMAGLLGLAINTFADSSPVAVLDLNQIFQQVPQGQDAFKQLQNQNTPEATQLQKQQDTLTQQLQHLQSDKSLTPAQQSAQGAQLLTQQEKLQTSVAKFQANAKQQQQDLLNTFNGKLNTAVGQIAKKNGYHLVLSNQTAIYNDGEEDITSQVIQVMKKNK